MTWPRQIYVATSGSGVYYTGDFSGPSAQPTWAQINTGLPAYDCLEFWLDPFEPDDRQYVLLNASRTLYMRTGGTWSSILTSAEIAAITGQATSAVSFCVDAENAGRIYVLCKATAFWEPIWSLRSDNYGTTWSKATVRSGWFTYNARFIRGHGDDVYATADVAVGASFAAYYSSNGASSWSAIRSGGLYAAVPIWLNTGETDRIYCSDSDGDSNFQRITSGGALTTLQSSIAGARLDSMWFDPDDTDHHRMVSGGQLRSTDDEWSTYSSSGAISPTPISLVPTTWTDIDEILVGLSLGAHVIGCLEGESDTTAVGIAGSSPGSSPYTDSIPNTCGGLARMGIQAVPLSANIYTYDVKFESTGSGIHTGGVTLEAPPGGGGVYTGLVATEE